MNPSRNLLLCCVVVSLGILLSACASRPKLNDNIGRAVSWSALDGWRRDQPSEAWPGFLLSCGKIKKKPTWQTVCAEAEGLESPTDSEVRQFFEQNFIAHRVQKSFFKRQGLITGYYEPLLSGSLEQSERYRYPVYRRPDDLVTVRLGNLHPELKKKRLRGRLQGNTLVPYFSRLEIHQEESPLKGNELLWVDSAVMLFFLHIQGSGRVQLPDGKIVGVGYADQNGHPYVSIGRRLIQMGELAREDVNLFSIRDWLRDHPDKAESLYNDNPSYIFFRFIDIDQGGPIGSLNVPLTPERSIATDREVIPLGFPVWLETTLPDGSGRPYRRLVISQDTGGAIKGAVRADLFWGTGERAEQMAGNMKQEGRLYILIPKSALR